MHSNKKMIRILAVLLAALTAAGSAALRVHAENVTEIVYTDRKEADAPSRGLERAGWIPEYSRTAPEGTIVLLLDPGHDSTHAGAQNGRLYEHELTFKIAQYCKRALEEYDGVEVHLTRESNACPYPGNNGDDLYQRVMKARTIGADAYISFHLNAGFQMTGSQVWVQTANWKPELHTKGCALGDCILKELSGLGLANLGNYDSSSKTMRYPDGSRADDLTVMRAGKRIDLLTVLIEHCFLSYMPDVDRYLSSEEKLQALGEADARGIAAYFGLSYFDDTSIYEADRTTVQKRLAEILSAQEADPDTEAVPLSAMYRLYQPRTHEHLYTSDDNEIRVLLANRWRYEGVAWYAPAASGTPVYRLFNPGSGEHFYTCDAYERAVLLGTGAWNDENIGWYSDDAKGMPVYRMFFAGLPAIASHHYTSDEYEYRVLTTQYGWADEAVAWYGAMLPPEDETGAEDDNDGEDFEQ